MVILRTFLCKNDKLIGVRYMKRAIYIVILLMSVTVLSAQQLTSYTCDFENVTENAQWKLNESAASRPLSEFTNKWFIGRAGGFGVGAAAASSGLYISSGTGADTLVSSYSNAKSVFVTASRTLQLAQGTYSVVFDYEAMGAGAPDGVYVFWVEGANTLTYGNYSDRTSLSLPPYATNTTRYGGVSNWRSSAFSFTTAGNGGKLVVLWLNSMTPPVEPAGKVDNIMVYPGTQVAPPTNVRYDGNTNTLSWNGSASSYDVLLYNYHTKTMSSFSGIATTSMAMPDLSEEGYYYIYVRSVSDNGHSTWVYTEKFVWIKGARCIDIFDLTQDNSGAAKCYWTDRCDYSYGGTSAGYTPYLYDHVGQVLGPNGADDETSRHVIHYKQGERDPRTGNQLKTIPDGEIASIRVNGFWDSAGDHASTIEYEYPVQAGVSDLLVLKFACVLENPSHDEDEQPRFKLDVLQGNTVVSTCAQKDFKVGFGDTQSWNKITDGPYKDTEWCDWQTVTVSLRDYIGSTLKIRLSAFDCTLSGHYGYAYFTLNCTGGDLQGIACGDFTTDHFEAPEGFNYRWYRANDPAKTVLGTNREFHIGNDDPTIYLVDIIDPNNASCYYTLEANPNPRFPQSKASVASTTAADCHNIVEIVPDCHVVRINRQTLDSVLTDEPVESVTYDFGDGSDPVSSLEPKVTHLFPAEGGEFDVTVTASISGGICTHPYILHLSLPDITTPDTHEAIHYCEEGTNRSDTTTLKNGSGCEYLQIRDHFYHSTYDTTYIDRICEGGRYFFPGDGKYYTATTDMTLPLTSVYGCDSLISLKLTVDPKLEVEYPHSVKACLEDGLFSMPYRTLSGSMDSIKVYFSAKDQEQGFAPVYRFANGEEVIIPLPAGARPDIYNVQVEFGGERCQMDIQPLQLMVTYPTSIVMQNGGFIATQNEEYNGGHKFVSFTWFKNGEKLDHTASYIPTSASDIGSTYVLSLMREGENYAVESCPIYYSGGAQGVDLLAADRFSVWPSSVEGGGTLYRSAGTACTVYNLLGVPVAAYPKTDAVSSFDAPAQSGMYIIVFDNHQSQPIIVR